MSSSFHGNPQSELRRLWLAVGVRGGSYHVGGFEGVPLTADAAGDTEAQAGVFLYPHTQLWKENQKRTALNYF